MKTKKSKKKPPVKLPAYNVQIDNYDRADLAEVAVLSHATAAGVARKDAVRSLLCNLRHYCDREGVEFNVEDINGYEFYTAELIEDGGPCFAIRNTCAENVANYRHPLAD